MHDAVDAFGYPVYLMISEGQRNDINYVIPVLEQTNIEGSLVIADCGQDMYKKNKYIYENGYEPIIKNVQNYKINVT